MMTKGVIGIVEMPSWVRSGWMIASAIAIAAVVLAEAGLGQGQSEFFPYIGLRTNAALVVTETKDGSPARKANLMPGDRIISINGTPVAAMDHATAVTSMRGQLGRRLSLTIYRGAKMYGVSMTRSAPGATIGSDSTPGQAPQMVPSSPSTATGPIEDPDKALVRIAGRTAMTDDVYQGVMRGLAYLPANVKRSFADAGVSIVITPTVEQLGLQGEGSEYSPRTHTVIICEQDKNGGPADLKRLHITTLHELGHAYDQLLGYPSRGETFHAVYNREAQNVPAAYEPRLSYFLQPGQAGPRECFASLFACKYYRGEDKRLTELRASFPQSFQYVESLHF